MNISEFFIRLDAKLSNKMWSWGAVTEDGTVILRCWAHEIRRSIDGKYQCVVLDEAYSKKSGAGYTERVQHLQRIKDGAESRLVIVTDVDAKKPQGKIKQFNSSALMIGAKIFTEGEKTYVECDGIEKLTNGRRNV